MTIFGPLLFVAVLLLCGFAVITLIDGPHRRSLPESIGLMIVMGAGMTGTLLTWASMIGAKPTRLLILTIGFCAVGLITLFGALSGLPRPLLPRFRQPKKTDLLLLVPMIPIVGAILVVGIFALRFDLFEADSIFIWGFKAKSLFIEPLKSAPPAFVDPGLSFTHQDYPLLLPTLSAATYSMIGAVNQAIGKLIFVLLFIAQSLLSFSAARRWLPTFQALIVSALLITLPFGVAFSGMGNPDSAIATFYLGSLIYLLRWIEHPRRADLIFCALCCAFMATTKSEGMPLAVIHAMVLAGFILLLRNQAGAWVDFSIFLLIITIVAGTWWLWRIGLPHTVDRYESRLRISILLGNLHRLGIIIPTLISEALTFSSWGAFWILVPLAGMAGYKAFSKSETWVLWILFLLHIGLYIFVYVITSWDVETLLGVSRNRLALHIAPAGMLLIALHWSAMRDDLSSLQ